MQNYNSKQFGDIFSLFPKYELEQAKCTSIPASIKVSSALEDKVDISRKGTKARKIIFGSTLATTIVSAGLVGLFFAKGLHGSIFKRFSNYTDKLSREIQDSESTKTLSKKIGLYTKKGIKKVIDTMQAASNFTAIKDSASDAALRTTKAGTKFAEGSKSGFKKVVDSTLGKKYHTVDIGISDLTSLLKQYNIKNLSNLSEAQKLEQISIKGVSKPLGEWIKILSEQTQKLETSYAQGFSLGARRLRAQKRTTLLSGISQKVRGKFFSKKGLFDIQNYKTYVTEDVSKSAQKELQDDIIKARKQVTNNIQQIYDGLKNRLNGFSQVIKPDDTASIKTLGTLTEKLEAFKNCSGKNEVQAREKISSELSSLINETLNSLKSNSLYTPEEQAALTKHLKGITNSLMSVSESKKGALEEIMTILKGLNGSKLLSDKDMKEYASLSKKISKGLTKASELEIGEYFLKQAELEVGSAPTDVLSVLFPIGVGAYSIAKGDNKEEKISATLTTCIPLVGTFATFVYGTTKMLSGAKNLAFSLISGIVLSKIGNYCDKLYKKYKSSGSVVKVAQEEYNKFWTEITPKYASSIKVEDK